MYYKGEESHWKSPYFNSEHTDEAEVLKRTSNNFSTSWYIGKHILSMADICSVVWKIATWNTLHTCTMMLCALWGILTSHYKLCEMFYYTIIMHVKYLCALSKVIFYTCDYWLWFIIKEKKTIICIKISSCFRSHFKGWKTSSIVQHD